MPGANVVGRYEIRSTLGIGGFAAVHRAYDPALDTEVAVKVLLPHFVDDEDIRSRFVNEARLLRRVESTHVVKVFDIGETDDGLPYFVMEYVTGGVLTQRLGSAVSRASLARIIDALASGLDALHEVSIVHRDIKPDNLLIAGSAPADNTQIRISLLADDERLVIGDLGLAKDASRTAVGPTISGGTPHFRAPEQMEPGAPITPAADIFAATGVLWNILTGSYPPDPSAVDAQLPSLPAAWQPVLRRGLERDPTLRHGSMADWAQHARQAVAASPDSDLASASVGDPTSLCPYKGMAAFQAEDAGLFFGRDELVDSLVAKLQHHPVLFIGGPSGSGKSSLLRAGLIPQLARGAIAGSQQWRVALFTPGRDAIGELLHQLRRLRSNADEQLTRADLPDGGRRWLDDGTATLIAIDQFEELFTHNSNRADQELFIATLAAMTESEHSRIRVVGALRADFYGACATYPWLADRINQSQLLVGPMSRAELRDAIVLPAQRAAMHLEDGLADLILDDVGSTAGALPLLGHALMETWLRRRGSQLTIEGYSGAGGVSGAIAQRADEALEQLDPAEQDAARRLLLRLTNPGDGTADTRRRVEIASLAPDPALLPVMQTLASARLLTTDEDTVEVAHEALLRSWPRLRRWIDDDRENLQTRRRISNAAQEWEARDHDPDLLYRGTPLAGAVEWSEGREHELEPVGQRFLAAAAAARDEQTRIAEAEHARRRRTRGLAVGALAVFALAALAASVVAFGALRQSQDDEAAARLSQAQALAAAASAEASERPLVATALALESIARSDPPTAEARAALVEARAGLDQDRWLPQAFGDRVPVGDMLSVTITTDGSRLITGGRFGSVVFWDRITRRELYRFDDAHDRGVEDFDISTDGQWLLSTGGSRALLWDLAIDEPAPIVLAEIPTAAIPIWNGAFSADASRVAIVSELNGLEVFDRATLAPVGTWTFVIEGVDMLSVAFLDLDTVIVGDGLGNLRLVDVRDGELIGDPVNAHETFDIWELAVHPDGDSVVSVSDDGSAKVWALSGDQLAPEPTVVTVLDKPAAAMWARDATEIVFGAADGRLHRVDPSTGQLIDGGQSMAVHAEQVSDAAVSSNGWMVSLADDQFAQIWKYIEGQATVGEILADVGPATDVALSADQQRIAVVNSTEAVVLDANTGAVLVTLPTPSWRVAIVDDTLLLTGRADGRIELWDMATGQTRGSHQAHGTAPVLGIAVSPAGDLAASVAGDGSVVLWDLADQTTISTNGHGSQEATAVAADPSGAFASVGADGSLRYWAADGTQSNVVALGINGPRGLAFHPTRDLLAVGDADEVARVLRRDGSAVASVAPLPGGVWDVAFAPDGDTLVTTSRDGEVLLWDWASATQLGGRFGFHERLLDDEELDGEAVIAVGASGVTWSAGLDGTLRRLDVLDPVPGCAVSADVLDQAMQAQFLGTDAMQSCNAE